MNDDRENLANTNQVLVDRTVLRLFLAHSTGSFHSTRGGYTKHSSWNDWHDALLAALGEEETDDA